MIIDGDPDDFGGFMSGGNNYMSDTSSLSPSEQFNEMYPAFEKSIKNRKVDHEVIKKIESVIIRLSKEEPLFNLYIKDARILKNPLIGKLAQSERASRTNAVGNIYLNRLETNLKMISVLNNDKELIEAIKDCNVFLINRLIMRNVLSKKETIQLKMDIFGMWMNRGQPEEIKKLLTRLFEEELPDIEACLFELLSNAQFAEVAEFAVNSKIGMQAFCNISKDLHLLHGKIGSTIQAMINAGADIRQLCLECSVDNVNAIKQLIYNGANLDDILENLTTSIVNDDAHRNLLIARAQDTVRKRESALQSMLKDRRLPNYGTLPDQITTTEELLKLIDGTSVLPYPIDLRIDARNVLVSRCFGMP